MHPRTSGSASTTASPTIPGVSGISRRREARSATFLRTTPSGCAHRRRRTDQWRRLVSVPLVRKPQLRGVFVPGDIASGYYNDMRDIAGDYGSPRAALVALEAITADRRLV